MPEPNCACAAGCNAAASPMANVVNISFLIGFSSRFRWMILIVKQRLGLLLRRKNLALNLGKMVGLRLAPCLPRFSLGFEGCYLLGGQLLSRQHSCGPRSLIVQTILGIGGVLGVVLLLQLLHLFCFALTTCNGKGE